MRKLDDDPMMKDAQNNVWTYEIPDGRRIKLDRDMVRKFGAAQLIRSVGLEPFEGDEEHKILPVYQDELKVGFLPATFDPDTAKSTTFWYEIRQGDFRKESDRWIACRTLGPGDLDAIPQFRRVRE